MEERICPICKNAVEDEKHVLLECPLYDDIRVDLWRSLSTVFSDIFVFSKDELLRCILGTKNEFVIKQSARACSFILKKRMQALYK